MSTSQTTAPAPAMSVREAYAELTAPGSKYETEIKEIGGVLQTVWKHAQPSLRELFLQTSPYAARDALVYEDDRVTYDAFARAVRVLAGRLNQTGVTKGARVALVMRNLPEWPVVFFAAAAVGAIVAPLNVTWSGEELAAALRHSGARLLVADHERAQKLAAHLGACPDLEQVLVSRAPPKAEVAGERLESLLGVPNEWSRLPDVDLPPARIEPDDDAAIIYTSGTTGRPKGALLSHRAIAGCDLGTNLVQARMRKVCGLDRGEARESSGETRQRVNLLLIPLFHVSGCCASMIPQIARGGKLVFMRAWSPETAMRLIERERVTLTGGVPYVAWQLLEHPGASRYDLSSLAVIQYGGAPSSTDLVRKVGETFRGVLPGNIWGMTETAGAFTAAVGPELLARPSSCGPAGPTGALRILDLDGRSEMPVGQVGELWVRGPQVMKGYWRDPEATAEVLVDGWLKTGDLACLDDEGYCFIVDRAKDMLIRAGENIYCVEIENALAAHPAVAEAAVAGIPDRIVGEEPAAVVTLRAGAQATPRELRDFVVRRLGAPKAPKRVLVSPDPLPRNAGGKVVKPKIRELLAAPELAEA